MEFVNLPNRTAHPPTASIVVATGRAQNTLTPKYPIMTPPSVLADPAKCPAELCRILIGVALSWLDIPNCLAIKVFFLI